MGKGRLSIYGKRKMKKALSVVVCLSLYKTNRFHVGVRLFSNRSQKTSKCGKNISDTLGYRLDSAILYCVGAKLYQCSFKQSTTAHELQKWEPAGRIGDFGNYFNGLAKSPGVLRSSWILNECNLYCKIVKYCILSEVCMIKTVPHSTVSPQMWCTNGKKVGFHSPRFVGKIL